MQLYIEIRAAEGGDDSKMFVNDLARSYEKLAIKSDCELTYQHQAPGITILKVSGKDLKGWYNEAGGHRIQRVPPTERNGRVHTSTVTVAVMNEIKSDVSISESDLKIEWYSGSGAGGQFRNKHQNSIRLTHIPTGVVQTAQTRSRKNSYNLAYKQLLEAVTNSFKNKQYGEQSAERKEQVGSGMRGDKVRTIRFRNNQAVDHRTDKKCTADQYMRGEMNRLWK